VAVAGFGADAQAALTTRWVTRAAPAPVGTRSLHVKALPSPRAHRKDARRWPPIECTRVIEDKFLKASLTFVTQFVTSSKFGTRRSNFFKKRNSPHILLVSLNVTLFSHVLRRNYPCHLFLLPWLKRSKKKKEKHHRDCSWPSFFWPAASVPGTRRRTLAGRAASSLPLPRSVAAASPASARHREPGARAKPAAATRRRPPEASHGHLCLQPPRKVPRPRRPLAKERSWQIEEE
jgi:hypothetical protein